jgi:hypothetical protein
VTMTLIMPMMGTIMRSMVMSTRTITAMIIPDI